MRFNTAPSGRTDGTFTDFDSLDDKIDNIYYYMQYIKFGFGRCIRDLSRAIQQGRLTREEALSIAKKYDGEYPEESIPHILKFLGLTHSELTEIIDSHRLPAIWKKDNTIWVNQLESNLS